MPQAVTELSIFHPLGLSTFLIWGCLTMFMSVGAARSGSVGELRCIVLVPMVILAGFSLLRVFFKTGEPFTFIIAQALMYVIGGSALVVLPVIFTSMLFTTLRQGWGQPAFDDEERWFFATLPMAALSSFASVFCLITY